MRRLNAHRLEGSRFGVYRMTSRIRFSVSSGQRMLQGAAPANYPARCIFLWLGFVYTPTIGLRSDGTFPGAACFRTFRPDQ
jgi:hypothetical protein